MCEAPSTCRARMWVSPPLDRIAEENGLIAAPGSPNTVVTPSRLRISTAAWAAVIRAISVDLPSGETFHTAQQRGVVERAVAVGTGRGDELGHEGADGDRGAD